MTIRGIRPPPRYTPDEMARYREQVRQAMEDMARQIDELEARVQDLEP